ncbi:hypothetical protein AKJ09_09698 [Labilithrix luteola]|uniref:Uncharacterized protein n=1 Tax=Labilithrix luteola TaxID=1391654 RepID=A0A0K1QC75_9BACT|nr:DUF692 domain-containing protein [Labilithrix luteola]AKV03035.1 hypothetical protein AKJ09_09698 [Labilithrix luteola]
MTEAQKQSRESRQTRTQERIQGVGLGLRWEFIDELLEQKPRLSFVEISPENYMGRGGYFDEALDRAAAVWPIVTHGLTMSLGGVDPLREDYLRELAAFLERVKTPWHSDHLCFSTFGGVMLHDLLPIPFKASEVSRIADRIKHAQDVLQRPMAIENVSFYLHPGKREMTEAEFIARVCEEADCGLMLDVNNAWVNATNFGYDVDAWMRTVPLDRVVQMHVAGHDWYTEDEWEPAARPTSAEEREGKLIVDTHGAPCEDEVLALLERTLEKTGPVPVLLERDQSIPPLDELLSEVARIEAIWTRATSKAAARAPSPAEAR